MKKYICALLSVVFLLGLFACTTAPEKIEPKGTCSLVVDCSILTDKTDTLPEAVVSCIPKDGIFFKAENIEFAENETPQALLVRLAKEKKLPVEFTDSVYGSYVEGIGGLYAGDAGELSGWLYTVNGEFLSVAASEYVLQPGDAIAFVYSCDMGYDIGYTD